MKTLLILSNSTNASNIGIIQNITQDNPIFFQALDLYINDKNNIYQNDNYLLLRLILS